MAKTTGINPVQFMVYLICPIGLRKLAGMGKIVSMDKGSVSEGVIEQGAFCRLLHSLNEYSKLFVV